MDFGPADALVPIMEQELAGMPPVFLYGTVTKDHGLAFRNIQQRAKAAKKPSGPGRGRGARKSAASTRAGEDVDMAETEGEVDAGEGGVDEGDEEEEEQEQEQEEGDEVDGEDGLVAGEQDEA